MHYGYKTLANMTFCVVVRTINDNQAGFKGGALYSTYDSHTNITFEGNSVVSINNNRVGIDGGAFYI